MFPGASVGASIRGRLSEEESDSHSKGGANKFRPSVWNNEQRRLSSHVQGNTVCRAAGRESAMAAAATANSLDRSSSRHELRSPMHAGPHLLRHGFS